MIPKKTKREIQKWVEDNTATEDTGGLRPTKSDDQGRTIYVYDPLGSEVTTFVMYDDEHGVGHYLQVNHDTELYDWEYIIVRGQDRIYHEKVKMGDFEPYADQGFVDGGQFREVYIDKL